ncbi:MAG: SufE family protein [Alphaproteobacteria bacterium]|nr:SufE family protein [Alphaproteobacteria bacterium]
MTIDELTENFSFLDSWEDRYKYLIELGNGLTRLSEKEKIEQWKVPGCQSQVWIIPHYDNDILHFTGDSDAIIVRGIIAIVLEIFKDKTAQEILDIDVEKIFDKMGLKEHITPNRRSGMLSMVDKIKYYATQALGTEDGYSRVSS